LNQSKLIDWINCIAATTCHNAGLGTSRHERRAMEHPRLFARQKPKGRISTVAKLFLDPKSPVVECILVDYSAGGACLQLAKFVQLPDRFEVLYGTTRKRCRVVWKRGLRFGVAF
jgi:PilZ domain